MGFLRMQHCEHCHQGLDGGQHFCDMKPTDADSQGVEFGSNCLTSDVCRRQNLCLGTCKLF